MLPIRAHPHPKSFAPTDLEAIGTVLTEAADWEFGTLFMCFILSCAFPLAISRVVADGLSQKHTKSNMTQLGPDRFLILSSIFELVLPIPRSGNTGPIL